MAKINERYYRRKGVTEACRHAIILAWLIYRVQYSKQLVKPYTNKSPFILLQRDRTLYALFMGKMNCFKTVNMIFFWMLSNWVVTLICPPIDWSILFTRRQRSIKVNKSHRNRNRPPIAMAELMHTGNEKGSSRDPRHSLDVTSAKV